DENSRAYIMAALESVGIVVMFNEDTPLELINMLRPDVLVKGSDYKAENIVGYDIVMADGGKVSTINFIPGYSTSLIEKKILDSK
ncbi:MAG: D-glycero-beta-D-manno-heptose 1-phosphate adenylyltransferase, partial [Bacteroidia bacterium]|nr:D-glycero-beta-D-manno-heptose 1-phosphate adenylyltransferase [Bacteroidia bacterium]